MKILIATTNHGKYLELQKALANLPVKTCSLTDLNITSDFDEPDTSFEDIAQKKARFYYKISGLPTIADDSGIEVEALKSELGTKTRRWGAGQKASDQEWIDYFLQEMSKVPNTKRSAKFISCISFYDGEITKNFIGESFGHITKKLEAPIIKGQPLSSVFKPLESPKVYSALSTSEKNKISHRGRALSKLIPFLKQYLDSKKDCL